MSTKVKIRNVGLAVGFIFLSASKWSKFTCSSDLQSKNEFMCGGTFKNKVYQVFETDLCVATNKSNYLICTDKNNQSLEIVDER